MEIYPLGDSAITIEFGNTIDEKINEKVISAYHLLKNSSIRGITDLVPAYTTLTIHFANCIPDLSEIEKLVAGNTGSEGLALPRSRQIKIPVCYDIEFGRDLSKISFDKNISIDQIISIHSSVTYRVYMLGFLPGFPYMGIVDESIASPRKKEPENVNSGSVGIAGFQTGIYPLDSPGGWNIIGRTPVSLFDSTKEQPCLLQPGDTVNFYSISRNEFESY